MKFLKLYYNSINCPGFNILNKQNSHLYKNYLLNKGRLPSACKWLYKSSSKFTNSLNDKILKIYQLN